MTNENTSEAVKRYLKIRAAKAQLKAANRAPKTMKLANVATSADGAVDKKYPKS